MPERHYGEGQQVDRERLLDLDGGRPQALTDVVKRGQVGVDRERAERRHAGQQKSNGAGGAPLFSQRTGADTELPRPHAGRVSMHSLRDRQWFARP